jgi:EAL domain-containing protein (putative c-di-GMP-specific phosphodiesterase class I)
MLMTAPAPSELAAACRGIGLRTVYQPIVDVARGVVAGYESLVRFAAPPANPELWFAAARRHGCEAELEAAALASALSMRATLPANCFLTVNVSPSALASGAVRQIWREHGSLDGLVVELTEQARIESYTILEPDLNGLRAAGALIAVDDAGAGYAGLRHLLKLRPSIIKLDRDLVADIDLDETKRALTEMLGTFASRIDAWLLAEGIEREGELDTLAALGVPLVQGYLLGRPGPPWVQVDTDAALRLIARSPRDARCGLRDHLVVAPATVELSEAAALFARPGVEVVVLVDSYERPVAALRPDMAALGVIRPGMRANVDTPVAEVAARAVTRESGERFAPVLCTDSAGRYLGVVPMERLITALAAGTDTHSERQQWSV